jgi:DegV family protein with EDD domain
MGRALFSVITDSTADIPTEIAVAKGIGVVPLSVTIAGNTLPDGAITQAEFFARMNASPSLPTTSQPAPGAFVEAYERALEGAEQVISVHISNKLSGTIEAARQAAQQFAGRVHVFDSLNLSWGLGLQVVEAAEAAAAGLDVESALGRLAEARDNVRLIVGLDSLDNLAKGGRIGRVSALMGALLNLKVTLMVDPNGEFQPVARERGEKAALKHTMEWIAEQMGSRRRAKFAVGHALSLERARALAEQIRSAYDVVDLVVYEAGSVICTHTGTGWGVAVLPLDPA